MSLPDLAAVLWRQRELLERLTYRLECEQLLLAAGRTRWLSQATTEIEMLTDELAVLEMQRALVADEVCKELGLSGGATLEDMAGTAQPPWTTMLLDHRNALVEITTELSALAETTRQLTSAGLAAVEQTLTMIGASEGGASQGYDARGRKDVTATGRRAMVDRAL